jgi:hypothetical protein
MVLVSNNETLFRNETSDIFPTHVRSETKCANEDCIYGLPTNDTLNEMKEKILGIPRFKSQHDTNYLGKVNKNNDTHITQKHEDEERRDDEPSDFVKVK